MSTTSSSSTTTTTTTTTQYMAFAFAFIMVVYCITTIRTYQRVEIMSDIAAYNNNYGGGVGGSSQQPGSIGTMFTMTEDQQRSRRRKEKKKERGSKKIVHPIKGGIETLQGIFPIHVGDDTEVIQHPALVQPQQGFSRTSNNKVSSQWPEDLPKIIKVPKFFDDTFGYVYHDGMPNTTIRQFLGSGRTLMTPEQAQSIGSTIRNPYYNNNKKKKKSEGDDDDDDEAGGSEEEEEPPQQPPPDSDADSDEDVEPEYLETIYCSIASYRDPECRGTLDDIYKRAKYPERIRVAILDQRIPDPRTDEEEEEEEDDDEQDDDSEDEDEDHSDQITTSPDDTTATTSRKRRRTASTNNASGMSVDSKCSIPIVPCKDDPEQSICKYRHLIDIYEMDARLAVGPVFARHIAHRHYRGEYYAMQIDSHVRFTKHWDVDIIQQWKSANNEMAVLTTYLSDIIGSIDPVTYENRHPGRPIMCMSDYEGTGQSKHLRHGQQPEGVPGIVGEPTLHPYWAAGFSFARGHFVIQIPYDQFLPMIFQGEEISIGLRGFTYGYDYYAPERSVCFHMYAIKENKEKRKSIPLFWENAVHYQGVGIKAMKRLNSIIGMNQHVYPSTEWIQYDKEKYGLGYVRTTSKFFNTYGIHVHEQRIEHHLCRFVGKRMMKLFKPTLRSNKMGLDYNLIDYIFVDPAPDEKQPQTKRQQ